MEEKAIDMMNTYASEQQRMRDHPHGTRYVGPDGGCLLCRTEVQAQDIAARDAELVRVKKDRDDWKRLYEKAWEEIRVARPSLYHSVWQHAKSSFDAEKNKDLWTSARDAHDAARKAAGL